MAGERENANTGRRVAAGILLVGLCIFLALGLFSYDWRDISWRQVPPNDPPSNLIGPVGAWLSFFLFTALGIGAYLLPLLFFVFGLMFLFNRETRLAPRAIWSVVLMVAVVSILELDRDAWESTCRHLNIAPDTGGIVGGLLMQRLLVRWLSPVGAGIVMWSLLLVALVLLVEMENIMRGMRHGAAMLLTTYQWCRLKMEERSRRVEEPVASPRRARPQLEPELPRVKVLTEPESRRREKAPEAVFPIPQPTEPALRVPSRGEPVAVESPPPKPAVARVEKPIEKPAEKAAEKPAKPPRPAANVPATPVVPVPAGQYQLPSIDLLNPVPAGGERGITADAAITARILVETLADFGIQVQVTNAEKGPVVTRYELLPAPGIRVEKIAGLSNNLALSLKAQSVRVQAPIPGKGAVGIEVPNTIANKVYVREVLEGDVWLSDKAKLPLILGKDVGGRDLVADLADMPHLLIAGATGSGKTVCMNAVLTGLLMARTPEQMRLLLVDPKIVEFATYNHLPHLVVPVITNPKKVAIGLRWAINEMEKRYKLFARAGVRNIEGYNSRQVVKQEELFGEDAGKEKSGGEPPAKVPYIVVVIDELADLMLADQAEIENCIARLAQLSRAVGIHMILSTQRPSVNVITGTIKANFPARIAFQVAQKVDSRTILDTIGAEKLLGRGDMLFLPPGSSKPIRAQGAMISDSEIHGITDFIRNQAKPLYELEMQEKMEKPEDRLEEGVDDELVEQAVQIIRETRRASTSSLQRRMRIGYTRAARLIDILEERGMLGPPRGAEPREILIDLDGQIPENAPDKETE